MTEHSKIPLKNARPADAGNSLFERANGAFSLDSMKPAAPPSDLPPPTAPKREQARPQQPVEPSPATAAKPAVHERTTSIADDREPQQVSATRIELGARAVRIDREKLQQNGMIVPDGPVTALREEFRIVKRELLGDARKAGTEIARRILVCSPHPNEGKTYCAVNLAISMAAEREIEVLLVDSDFANPSVPRVLGIEQGQGLMDALSDPSVAVEDLVLATDIRGLFVLPAGKSTPNDAEYLASARTGELLDRLSAGAPNRVLIFDTPPALAASPAAELAKHVGQALLVARADVTGQSALDDAVQLLSACPDIKLCLNATQFSPSGRTFGSYEGYGS